MWPNPQFPADLVTSTEEIINGKLHILCSEKSTAMLQNQWNGEETNERILQVENGSFTPH